jgi:tetraprenyl-beta-curcumene synthase
MRSTVQRVDHAATFARAARRYWFGVFVDMRRELDGWRRRAARIPDPVLRHHALAAHETKRMQPEGAAAFAVLAPRSQRSTLVRALVACQVLYDYIDTLSEQPGPDPLANTRRLHRALMVGLDPSAPQLDYYACNSSGNDNGYLNELADTCREACASLPSYPIVSLRVSRLAARAVHSQGFNHGLASRQVSDVAVARWALDQGPPDSGLLWWELLGAAASSLAIYALLAAAAHPTLRVNDVKAIEDAYFPWAGALHALLDSLVDQTEDAIGGEHNHVRRYTSPEQAAKRLGAIASQSLRLAYQLPQGQYHAIILVGMVSYYLSTPEASLPEARRATRSVLEAVGSRARLALLILRARRRTAELSWRSASGRREGSLGEDSGGGMDRPRAVRDPPAGREHVSS